MSEGMLMKELGKERVLALKPHEFEAAKKAVRYKHTVRRASLLGMKDAATAPRAQVMAVVTNAMRRIQVQKHGGMKNAATAPMVSHSPSNRPTHSTSYSTCCPLL
jgi:hypothetical protein